MAVKPKPDQSLADYYKASNSDLDGGQSTGGNNPAAGPDSGASPTSSMTASHGGMSNYFPQLRDNAP